MRNFIKLSSLAFFLVIIFTVSGAKSLYVVHHYPQYTPKLTAFKINENNFEYQTQIVLPSHGYGPIDIEIDQEAGILFISYEDTSILELYSAAFLNNLGDVTLTGPTDVTGLAYDTARKRLYCTDRSEPYLYVYDWDADNLSLTPDENNPYTLTNDPNACGLALDGDTLYVTRYEYVLGDVGKHYEEVYVYDVSDNFSYSATLDMDTPAVAVACDHNSGNPIVYTGAFRSDNNIAKFPLPSGPSIFKTAPAQIIATEVDPDTGYLFTTAYSYSYYGDGIIQMFDPSGWTSQSSQNVTPIYEFESDENIIVSNLAGLCIGGPYLADTMLLSKDDNITGCVDPTDEENNTITYTIAYDPNGYSYTNVSIIDHLPMEVYYDNPDDPNYEMATNTYTWYLGDVSTSGQVQLTVVASELAKPGGKIVNTCQMTADFAYSQATRETTVCCWNTNSTIFVDDTATGLNNGTTWTHAYNDLQDALIEAGARTTAPEAVWIAQGTYTPGTTVDDTFALVNTVDLIGGLVGNEDPCTFDPNDRNLYIYKSILTGNTACNNVITADSSIANTTLLDGLVITSAVEDGLHSAGSPQIHHCTVKNNARYGLYLDGSGKTPSVENSNIYDNADSGMYCTNSTPIIKNNWIHHNGDAACEYGIELNGTTSTTLIRNNTIAYNFDYAVSGYNLQPLRNCILWGNNTGGQQTTCSTKYCCIDPAGSPGNGDPDGDHNITCLPGFAYNGAEYDDSLYDFHLAADSLCIGKGDPNNWYTGETDIDNDLRVVTFNEDPDIDLGADEVACDEITHDVDLVPDGAINLREFALLKSAWLTDSQDPNYNDEVDFVDDDEIDIDDFAEFVSSNNDYWLWHACWHNTGSVGAMMMSAPQAPGFMPGVDTVFSSPDFMPGVNNAVERPAPPTPEELELLIDQLYDGIDDLMNMLDEIGDAPEGQQTAEQIKEAIDGLYEIIDGLEKYLETCK